MKFTAKSVLLLIIAIYSFSVISFGISANEKGIIRTICLLVLVFTFFMSNNQIRISNLVKLYLACITLPLIFSFVRQEVSYSLLQYFMYINCIGFVILWDAFLVRKSILDLLAITSPIIIFFVFGGFILDLPEFWRSTFTDGAIRLGGELLNPNELGMLSSITIILSIAWYRESRNKFFSILLIISALLTLISTESRSSMIGFLIATFMVIPKKNMYLLVFSTIILLSFSTFPIIEFLIPRIDALDDVKTLTGRSDIWKVTMKEIVPEYLFIGAGWQIFPGKSFGLEANMPHNTFIQQLVGGGIIGFILSILLSYKLFVQTQGYYRALFIIILINSLTEFGFLGFFNHTILFIVLIMTRIKDETAY